MINRILNSICLIALLALLDPTLRAADTPTSAPATTTNPTTNPTTGPSTKPTTLPTADYQVIDWSIFVADPTDPHANSLDAVKSTFPSFVISRRSSADAEPDDHAIADKATDKTVDTSTKLGEAKTAKPMPIGVIRVVGGKDPSPKFDVLLNIAGGEFESQWPRAESRPNRLLWSNLIASAAEPAMQQFNDKDWMNRLRDADSRYLTSTGDSRGERFLMYDAQPTFTVPLKIEQAGDNAYKFTNTGSPDLVDFEIYKGKPDGWRSARVDALLGSHLAVAHRAVSDTPKIKVGDSLAISASGVNGEEDSSRTMRVGPGGTISLPMVGSVKVIDKTTDEAKDAIIEVYHSRNIPITDMKIEISAATPTPTTQPTTSPAGPANTLTLADTPATDPAQVLAGWNARLATAGVAKSDVDLIVSILGKYALDPGRLTAVYMLNQTEMDDLLPMQIVPVPAKVTRVGIVVIRNIDPAINQEIDQLVKDLGDDDWSKREAAQKKLTTFGRAAKSAVEKSAKSKDMEVVWRSEAILQKIDPKAVPPGQ